MLSISCQSSSATNVFFQTKQTGCELVRTLKQIVIEALKADLNKPEFETYATEVGVIKEIDYAIKHIKSWTSPKELQFRLSNFRQWKHLCRTAQVVLIIGPTIPADNFAVSGCDRSETVQFSNLRKLLLTSRVLADLIQKPTYIAVVEGGVEASQQLLAEKFDHIFFYWWHSDGKIVMEAAKTSDTSYS